MRCHLQGRGVWDVPPRVRGLPPARLPLRRAQTHQLHRRRHLGFLLPHVRTCTRFDLSQGPENNISTISQINSKCYVLVQFLVNQPKLRDTKGSRSTIEVKACYCWYFSFPKKSTANLTKGSRSNKKPSFVGFGVHLLATQEKESVSNYLVLSFLAPFVYHLSYFTSSR